jgi:phage gp45-like
MANVLSDGTVIPSFLGTRSRGAHSGSTDMLNDYTLRLGEIKKIIYPNDPLSYGKKTVEYDIEVQYRENNGTYVTSYYRGATVSTVFGGVGDRFHATFREDASPASSTSNVGTGSKVLCLCLAGDQQKAIILGGIEDPNSTRVEDKKDGHNLAFEFNGVKATINKDGEFQIRFAGPTDDKGVLLSTAKAADSGALLKFTKDGSVIIATEDGNDHKIVLDHQNKEISLTTTGDWKGTVDGTFDVKAKDGFKFNSSKGGYGIGVKDTVEIQSAGVMVGQATDAWIKGTTYRQAESLMNKQVSSAFTMMATLCGVAGVALMAASVAIVPPIVGGAAAAVPLQAAAQALNQLALQFTQVGALLTSFESSASTYISTLNFGD